MPFTETDVNTRCKQGQRNSTHGKWSEVQIKGAKNDIEKKIYAWMAMIPWKPIGLNEVLMHIAIFPSSFEKTMWLQPCGFTPVFSSLWPDLRASQWAWQHLLVLIFEHRHTGSYCLSVTQYSTAVSTCEKSSSFHSTCLVNWCCFGSSSPVMLSVVYRVLIL